jgi:hypothetical protein
MLIVVYEYLAGGEIPTVGYAKLVWLEPTASGFYYCTVAFDLGSAGEARQAENTSIADDLSEGCNGRPWEHDIPLIEIAGNWFNVTDQTDYTVDSERVVAGEMSLVVEELDNETNTMIVSLALIDTEYSKIVWTEPSGGEFYACSLGTTTSLETASELEDDSIPGDLETGCGGEPWQHFVEALEITGEWYDGEVYHDINSQHWDGDTVIEYSNEADFVVTQNGDADEFPGYYNLIVWIDDGDYMAYCVTAADIEDPEGLASAFTAVPSDLDFGCGGAPWTVWNIEGDGGATPQ